MIVTITGTIQPLQKEEEKMRAKSYQLDIRVKTQVTIVKRQTGDV
jgi:hypothetical protein